MGRFEKNRRDGKPVPYHIKERFKKIGRGGVSPPAGLKETFRKNRRADVVIGPYKIAVFPSVGVDDHIDPPNYKKRFGKIDPSTVAPKSFGFYGSFEKTAPLPL